MLQIEDTLVSLDLIERYFVCNLSACKGNCCVEGEAGAPLEKEEFDIIRKILPEVWNDLSFKAKKIIDKQGIGYIDAGGETVTSLVDGKDCVFTYYDTNKICSCAIEKAFREQRIAFQKPVSCHLYPVRITQYKHYRAVNYQRWKVCRSAEILGEKKQIPIYRFLSEPLIRKFGKAWYDMLDLCAHEYLKH